MEVMAELLGKLAEDPGPKAISAGAGKEKQRGGLHPNLDRLTVGVCIWVTNGASTAFWAWAQKR